MGCSFTQQPQRIVSGKQLAARLECSSLEPVQVMEYLLGDNGMMRTNEPAEAPISADPS